MTSELINLNKDATIKLWMERVSACRASNLTVRAWCQQNDIPCSSYYHWQRKLFDTAVANAQAPVSQFAEISVSTTSITSKEVTPEVIASLEVNGITVQLYSNAKASSIAVICLPTPYFCFVVADATALRTYFGRTVLHGFFSV